jgi:hypothetical protein
MSQDNFGIHRILPPDIMPEGQENQGTEPPNYSFEDYTDNWSNWQNQFPSIPPGASGDVGFMVPNNDGTMNPNYPITPGPNSPAQGNCPGLAVGGWNASQPGGSLYNILTQSNAGGLTPAQQTLINTILQAAQQNGYNRIIMDYENYSSPPPDPATYTTFLEALGAKLHSAGISLEIAISPNPQNQQYYNIGDLVRSGAVDDFQVMCYDYAMGLPSPTTIQANSGVAQTQAYLKQLIGSGPNQIPPNKATIGVAFYGISYKTQAGLTPAEVASALANGTLTGSYANPQDPQISDDDILQSIGSWTNPSPPWSLVHDGSSPPNYFYYNSQTGGMYSAFPPASINDFASMIKTNFPGVAGFFAWDADNDRSGQMMQQLEQALIGNQPPSIDTCINEFMSWLGSLQGVSPSWIQQIKEELTTNPPTSDQAMATWLNNLFASEADGKDFYMQSGLLLASPTGNVMNQLDTLFSKFTNLLPLLSPPYNVQMPTPTFADTALAQAQAWTPDSQGGQALKSMLLTQLESQGSNYSKAALDQWAYSIPQSEYANLSATDSAMFTLITGAWL